MSTIPPGWYDDGAGSLRWWDGREWTPHMAQGAPAMTIAEDLHGRRSRARWPWVVIALLGLGVIVSVVAVVASSTARRGAETPEAALGEYLRAWESGDCEAIRSVTTPKSDAWFTDCAAFEDARSAAPRADVRVEFLVSQVEGYGATFGTKETWSDANGDHEEHYVTSLVDEDGSWRIWNRELEE